jgi:hypothetical protein
MLRFSPVTHFFAIILACLVVFIIRPQQWINLAPLMSPPMQALITDFTPYYPGQKELYRHEIFSPFYAHTKKIVIIGASVAESIGCDSSWSTPDPVRPTRNVHYTCSVAGHINELLKNKGLDEWHAFNLGREGARLTSMLYTYARIADLKPEIVIFTDAVGENSGLYSHTANAGAAALDAEMYSYMDHIFSQDPAADLVWHSYRDNLIKMGSKDGWQFPARDKEPDFSNLLGIRKEITLNDILVRLMDAAHDMAWKDTPPWPVKFRPEYKKFTEPKDTPFVTTEDDLNYLQGYKLFQLMQARNGGKFLYYFSPMYQRRKSRAYHEVIASGAYGSYFQQNGVPYVDLSDLPLTPVYETYDGTHQTTFGNIKIAETLVEELEKRKFLP